MVAGTWSAGSPIRRSTERLAHQCSNAPLSRSPKDKNVYFHDAAAAFTVSPEPGALLCRADLP